MNEFKAIKARARENLKGHYMLLMLMCAVCVILGTEFNSVIPNAQLWYDLLNGRPPAMNTKNMLERATPGNRLINDLMSDDLSAGREEAAARMQDLKEGSDPNAVLGRQKGALAALMNNINSGNLYAMLVTALHSLFHSHRLAAVLMILGSLAIYAAVWIFIRNLYSAVLRRTFLETRLYKAVPMSHLLHPKMVNRWVRSSLTLLLASVYEMLWWLTLAGGAIKHYSYLMVPFIVAENPDIRPREAVALSRRMMNGHKWEAFRLELSFLGWLALGFVTFGIVDALWTIPYRLATHAELYARLREEAIAGELEGSKRLNDRYLFEGADVVLLRLCYDDITRRQDVILEDIVLLSPVKRFFARNFGLWLGTLNEKKVYARQAELRQRTRVERLELSGSAYPERLNPLWNREGASLTHRVNYLTPCTVWSLIAVFFVFCVVGWMWEVGMHLMTHGQFVNRGALHGPWLPIYGSGVVMIAVLLYRLRAKPMLEALAVVLLCGVVEYMTSFVMEASRGMRWWDYTGFYLNLNGRICAEGLAMFAVGGMTAVYVLVPIIDAMVTRVRPRLLVGVCVALMVCFACDVTYSHFVPNAGTGITDDPETPARAATLPIGTRL